MDSDLFEFLANVVLFLLALGGGLIWGTANEKRHYRSIIERERKLIGMPAVTSEDLIDEGRAVSDARFVAGNVVIANDYFKLFVSGLQSIFGGRITVYESLVDRGRREAVLRLKESAGGADAVLNLRIETSRIDEKGNVEAFAYGTAVYYRK